MNKLGPEEVEFLNDVISSKTRRAPKSKDDGEFKSVFVRDRGEGRGARVAGPKPTDLSSIDQAAAMERLAQQEKNKQYRSFPTGPSGTRPRKTKLAVMGLSLEALKSGDPAYASCIRIGNAYRKIRQREMYVAHGYVSSGVSALLSSAALALAGARFIYETCAATSEEGEDGPQLVTASERRSALKTAAQLSDSARQNELSAWELCAREGVVRKRNEQGNVQSPWLVSSTVNPTGQEKRGPGRPRKVQQLLENNPDARTYNVRENQSNGTEGTGEV